MAATGIDLHLEHLKLQFHEAAIEIYQRAIDEAGYTAHYFLSMVTEYGGWGAAKKLLHSEVQSGFTEMYLRGRLDLTLEALIHDNPIWHPLFTPEELAECEKRLSDRGYFQA
jgi:hypothetical protein